ncbi:MAG: sigma-70 family RNA polymerase sigma factor [Candidatus Poribacteria bacterium]|nr:sigma-70 family RNA polymerase sigma factor [Candidatus Poribacteria bacterium]
MIRNDPSHEINPNFASPRKNEDVLPRCVQTFPDDAQLIEQFQHGEKSVFDQLVLRYQDRIYRLARRFVENAEDAQDLTQEAFLRTYQKLPDFKRGSQFYTWLYRITTNLCIDFHRRNAARKAVIEPSASADFWMNLPEPHLPPPSKAVENQELLAQIRQAIFQLPPKQREIFFLHHQKGLPLKEIAHTLGRAIGTVKAHLFAARQNLQGHLRPYLQSIGEPSQK